MKDYRQDILNDMRDCVKLLDVEDVNYVLEKLTLVLSDYNVDKIGTDIVLYDNENENLLRMFASCLMLEGKSELTIFQYIRTARKLAMLNGKHFREMTSYDVRWFLASEKSRRVANVTLENTRANLSAFFQWMQNEEIIEHNPCFAIKPIKCELKEKFPFSAVELDALRSACRNNRERAIVEVLISTGMRASEITSVMLGDVDINQMTIHVKHGKGNKERLTYLTDVAKEYLLRYVQERPENGSAMFYSVKHTPITPHGLRDLLNRLGKRAGVDNVHPHRFRRTFATNLASRGMKVQDVQRLLGHTDINTTMKYVCVDDNKVKLSYKQFTS